MKKFFLFFLPLFFLFFIIVLSFLFQEIKAQKTILLVKEKQKVSKLGEIANDEVKSVVSDLFFLSVHPLLHQMLETDNPGVRQKLENEFRIFCSNSKLFDQIRFLDETGMEQIRINFNQNQPIIVPENKLQNKGKRYYFADTFALEPGQIFMSPFDLNIEHGQIEYPLKPMIRFGTPIVNYKGQKRGIVLLNYLGANLINTLKQTSPDSQNSFALLNCNGYWLKGPTPEDEWGFMYKDHKNKTLANLHPAIWEKISEQNEGQFFSDHGIYTFTTVYLLNRGMLSSTGSDNAFEPSSSILSKENFYWKIVSVIKQKQLKEQKKSILLSWLPYLIIFFLVIVLLSFVLSLAAQQRKKAMQERLKREKLQGVLEITGAVCHEINQPLMMISGNAELLLQDTPENKQEYKKINAIFHQSQRIGTITKKLMKITQYKTKDYLKGKIIDIEAASNENQTDTD